VIYFLDTNACVAVLKNQLPARTRFWEASRSGAELLVSSVVLFELSFGIAKSTHRAQNEERLARFLSGPLKICDFDGEDARAAGEIRAALAMRGQPIGPYDLLIAGQALCRGARLVTSNLREFSRVDGLAWEDWAA